MGSAAAYWFRNDLRLEDNPNFLIACNGADFLLPIYCHDHQHAQSRWGFDRIGEHRRYFLRDCLVDLRRNLNKYDSNLIELSADAANERTEIDSLMRVLTAFGITTIYCEAIAAPEEAAQIEQLREAGFVVHLQMHSTMIAVDALPFSVEQMPDQFTQFRQKIEKAQCRFTQPLASPAGIPPLPPGYDRVISDLRLQVLESRSSEFDDSKSNAATSFPYRLPGFCGGESAALAHLRQYLDRSLPHTYKVTRNQLFGLDYSSKFSPWLAYGCISARAIAAQLQVFEGQRGANEGSYWLWFELLWRDYFRILHLKWGKRLYAAAGLGGLEVTHHHPKLFEKWCQGNTGEAIVDAGMRELHATGYLSNRLRQVVASYLIYDLDCDWRAGASWFESQLIDYDAYSNQGNWLYIAGRGTDPRGGRRFNPQKQALDHDPDGTYRAMWKAR